MKTSPFPLLPRLERGAMLDGMNSVITVDPNICNGQPVMRGKRISVQTVLEFLSAGDSPEDILEQYPSLTKEDIQACLEFAKDLMARKYVVQPVA